MLSRRLFLTTASWSALALCAPLSRAAPTNARIRARPVPLSSVRLLPSLWLNAVERNRAYLLWLDPDRLLHHFRKGAGLVPKAPSYGGWEGQGIAGHTLGHYLSACALMHAQTGDAAMLSRIRHIIAELAECQRAHGDGYIGATMVERGGQLSDGKVVFEEVRRGEINSKGFDLNGGWVPLYTWHKVQAGLTDAYLLAGVADAFPVLLAMATYLATILEGLDDEQMQRVLVAEYGGVNESYAELYAITGNVRWLRLARRIRDARILDPLAQGRDDLPGLHANTQIPKLIGLARLYELTGDPAQADAARFFHQTVVHHHSYVIGGNSEREHFGPPGVIASRITERTCEACNSYNMLKLTRHLYGWAPDAGLFDYYERVHLNHILAHQHPDTGMFVYFMPLSAGAARLYSDPGDSFWCCVGSGMESHAKHGDSIFWQGGNRLYVNLYIPARLTLDGFALRLETSLPYGDRVTLVVEDAVKVRQTLALRLPGWCATPLVAVNGQPAGGEREGGYAILTRDWRVGDRIDLTLPMMVRAEPVPDDPTLVAYSHGPVVLAADLGPAALEWADPPPALVTASSPATAPRAVDADRHLFTLDGAEPGPVRLAPFFSLYDRRSAVYFPSFTAERWAKEEAGFRAEQQAHRALEARTVDVVRLGEQQSEQDHAFATNRADLRSWSGRSARALWWGAGNHIELTLSTRPGASLLWVLYWGEDVKKHFTIAIDGKTIAEERLPPPTVKGFVAREYPIPPALAGGMSKLRVRFDNQAGEVPIYEVRILTR